MSKENTNETCTDGLTDVLPHVVIMVIIVYPIIVRLCTIKGARE